MRQVWQGAVIIILLTDIGLGIQTLRVLNAYGRDRDVAVKSIRGDIADLNARLNRVDALVQEVRLEVKDHIAKNGGAQ